MAKSLSDSRAVKLELLYPDPNNPRLAGENPPGYDDVQALFSDSTREEIFKDLGQEEFKVAGLVDTIAGLGWLPIDNIIVWQPPDEPDRYVVVEGNRRLAALQRIHRDELPRAEKALERMKKNNSPKAEIKSQEETVQRLSTIVESTEHLEVEELIATNSDELEYELQGALAVRQVTGPRKWSDSDRDIWLQRRYYELFEETHGDDADIVWDDSLTKQMQMESGLTFKRVKTSLMGNQEGSSHERQPVN